MFVDTLHPAHEGRLFRLGYGLTESPLLEYGRTSPDALAHRAPSPNMWSRPSAGGTVHTSQTGESFLRRRLNDAVKDEFPILSDLLAAGNDRLPRDHHPLCPRRCDRRDGW